MSRTTQNAHTRNERHQFTRYNYEAAAAAATVYMHTIAHYYASTNERLLQRNLHAPTQAHNAIPERTIANNVPR